MSFAEPETDYGEDWDADWPDDLPDRGAPVDDRIWIEDWEDL